MAEITAQMIKELRDRTGVGMSKCKSALDEAAGDMELAISNLRKAGMASAVKKADRDTKEGMIGIAENDSNVAIVEVNAETDFVVKNDRFQEFLQNIAKEVNKTAPQSLESFLNQPYSLDSGLSIDAYRATMVQTIGENIQVKRFKTFNKDQNSSIGVYSHLGGKIVTVVVITGSNDQQDLAKDIAMHVAAASPEYLNPEAVPQEIISNEREIAKSQMAGKPESILDKIIAGKLNAFYDETCLVKQKYIKNDSVTITELVDQRGKEIGKPLVVSGFVRWNVGQ